MSYSKEDNLQMVCMRYLGYAYPKILAIHVANERKTSLQHGAKLKKMGVRAGVPDILIFKKKGALCGCAIELKIKPNKPTPKQTEFLNDLEAEYWITRVCYSFDEFEEVVNDYLKTEKKA